MKGKYGCARRTAPSADPWLCLRGWRLLEEQFASGYLRFNDDTAAVLQPYLSLAPTEDAADFIKQWNNTSRSFADFDALRLLLDFSHFLPIAGGNEREKDPARKFPPLLHAHLLGKKLGAFEVFWDASLPEPLWVGQSRLKDDLLFFDVWTSFAPAGTPSAASGRSGDAAITAFRIHATVTPPDKTASVDGDECPNSPRRRKDAPL